MDREQAENFCEDEESPTEVWAAFEALTESSADLDADTDGAVHAAVGNWRIKGARFVGLGIDLREYESSVRFESVG